MRIAVCVKYVPDGVPRLDPESGRVDRSGDGTLNRFDANAIEEALRLKDAVETCDVVLVSLGPEKALEGMRKGLAMGADRAVLVSDAGAAGSDLLATSYALAAAIAREDAALVLLGQQGADSDGAMLCAALAEQLRRPLVSQAASLALDGQAVRCRRQTEFGYETIEAPLPAVVAVSDAINEPRYPALKGIMGAKKRPQETLSLADLGVDADRVGVAGSQTRVVGVGAPPARGAARRIEDDGSAAEQILAFLQERRLL